MVGSGCLGDLVLVAKAFFRRWNRLDGRLPTGISSLVAVLLLVLLWLFWLRLELDPSPPPASRADRLPFSWLRLAARLLPVRARSSSPSSLRGRE